MKKHILLSALLLVVSPVANADDLAAGVFIGSPMSGLTLKKDNLKLNAGVDEVGMSFDVTWNVGDWLGRPELSPIYAFAGGQWVDDDTHKWGPRAGLGVVVPVGNGDMELFAEAGTTWYLQDESDLEFEGSAGARVYF